jgi:hypothetical protein
MKKEHLLTKSLLALTLVLTTLFIFGSQAKVEATECYFDTQLNREVCNPYVTENPVEDNRTTTTFDIAGEAQSQGAPGTQNLSAADGGFGTWVSSLMRVVMLAGVLVAFVFLILGAIEWITSGGDKGKVESARGKITNAVIGLIVLAAVTAILALVQDFLGVSFINF